MIKYFKKYLYLYVFIVINSISLPAFAGAYEDFFKAVVFDDATEIRLLLQRGFDPNARSENHAPALVLAAAESALRVLDVLLNWPKIDVRAVNRDGETALMLLCLNGKVQAAKRLIDRDADVNQPGWTALHYAASGGQVAAIHLLLAHHAYIDAESPNGTTPLMMAAQYGNIESVKLLLERGADATLKNQLKLDALDFAEIGSRPDAIKLLSAVLRRQPKPQF